MGRYIFDIVWVDRAVLVGTFDPALGDMKKNQKTATTTRKEVTVAMVKVSVVVMPHKWRKEVWMRCWVQGRRRTKQTKHILVVHSSTLCRRERRNYGGNVSFTALSRPPQWGL